MPSKSAAQHRLMEAIAHGAKPKSGHGPSKKVAKEFVNADRRNRGYKKVTHKSAKGPYRAKGDGTFSQ